MGANAVTTVPVYVAGEVLTAADLNITNSGIPVFASTVERDAAFGGTGEKTLAEGQFAYLEDSNTTQYYDGAAWQTVGVTPGLVCVKAETAFSAVTSLTADSVFTSSYTNYRLVIRYQISGGDELAMKLRAATVDTSTGYNFQRLQASGATVDGVQSTSQTSGFVGHSGSGAFWCLTTLEISGVQLAEPTVYQAICTRNNSAYTSPIIVQYFGNQSASTAFDGIKLLVASGTMTGSYTIYGYSKAV
jgi:hypothetical protein